MNQVGMKVVELLGTMPSDGWLLAMIVVGIRAPEVIRELGSIIERIVRLIIGGRGVYRKRARRNPSARVPRRMRVVPVAIRVRSRMRPRE